MYDLEVYKLADHNFKKKSPCTSVKQTHTGVCADTQTYSTCSHLP